MACSFAHIMVGGPRLVKAPWANPQSLPAMTFSRPTSLAYCTMRCATSSGGSTRLVVWATTPGMSILPQGHSVFVEALHDRFPAAIKGCVRGGALLARHPPREPQPFPTVEPDDNTSTSAH